MIVRKKNIAKTVFILALLVFTTGRFFAQSFTQNLLSNWQFSESGKNEWMPATVPGTVHTDLLSNGKIPDPFLGLNEAKVQWVETKTWEYKTVFDCDKELWKQKKKALYFDGLDTYADVFLNDSLLFTGEDMFLAYSKDVTKFLRKKQNVLRIVFHPATELIEKNKAKEDIKHLPGGDRVFIRKAQYQFGWDWGPRLVTAGIWKPVRLEGWSGTRISGVRLRTDALQNDTAFIEMSFDASPAFDAKEKIGIKISDENGQVYYQQSQLRSSTELNLLSYIVRFVVPHPRLWWCNGMGKPEQYEFTCEFSVGKKKIVQKIKHGIRKIELDMHPDATGFSHTFYLNDKPVFCKGANWIPNDNFLPRVTTAKYYSLLKTAQQSNMNMLRVWGGGVYEDDAFYSICDSLGIMVWQDFMFAGGIYPSGLGFTNTVLVECAQQFLRINQHPCVAAWCGNNEITEAWMNWGWQKEENYSAKDSVQLFSNYLALFYDQLKTLVSRNDRNAIYWPSSPSTGWGHPEAYNRGDVHYWGVWWGMEPFSAYDTHVGRFVSEYGFQGMPDERSFSHFAGVRYLTTSDSTVRAHQKHPTGFETIRTYMERDYPVPQNFSDYIYVSQVMQRDAMSRAIEAHRRAMPYCMGTLFWQYNDCWPVTSWSSTDFYQRPKLAQYALKDLYAHVLVSVTERNDSVLIYLVNDDTLDHDGLLGFQWMNFDGMNIRTSASPSFVKAGTSRIVAGFSKTMLLDTLAPEKGLLHVVFNYDGKVAQTNHYFAADKKLALPSDPGLSYDIDPNRDADGNWVITIRTVHLAKDVYLFVDEPGASFSDNGFDLLPNEERTIRIRSALTSEALKKLLTIKTMNAL